jgi:hypothetical protein
MNAANEWTVYRTRFLVRACQLKEPLAFTDALGREHAGNPGDYLVESFEGCFSITPHDIFEDIYVPVSLDTAHDSQEGRATLERALWAQGSWTAQCTQPANPPGLGPEPGSSRQSVANGPQVPA